MAAPSARCRATDHAASVVRICAAPTTTCTAKSAAAVPVRASRVRRAPEGPHGGVDAMQEVRHLEGGDGRVGGECRQQRAAGEEGPGVAEDEGGPGRRDL